MIVYLFLAAFFFWLCWVSAKQCGIRPRRVTGILLIFALAWPLTCLALLVCKVFDFLSEVDISDDD